MASMKFVAIVSRRAEMFFKASWLILHVASVTPSDNDTIYQFSSIFNAKINKKYESHIYSSYDQ